MDRLSYPPFLYFFLADFTPTTLSDPPVSRQVSATIVSRIYAGGTAFPISSGRAHIDSSRVSVAVLSTLVSGCIFIVAIATTVSLLVLDPFDAGVFTRFTKYKWIRSLWAS